MTTRTISDIARDLATQDNECTANPQFVVQKHQRIWGLDPDYTEDCAWVCFDNGDHEVADAKLTRQLDSWRDNTDELELYGSNEFEIDGQTWRRVGYRDQWVFVTACLTRAGCEEYLRLNGHNLGTTRIMVEGETRNKEWEALRAHIARMPALYAVIKAAHQAHAAKNERALGESLGALMGIITHLEGCPP